MGGTNLIERSLQVFVDTRSQPASIPETTKPPQLLSCRVKQFKHRFSSKHSPLTHNTRCKIYAQLGAAFIQKLSTSRIHTAGKCAREASKIVLPDVSVKLYKSCTLGRLNAGARPLPSDALIQQANSGTTPNPLQLIDHQLFARCSLPKAIYAVQPPKLTSAHRLKTYSASTPKTLIKQRPISFRVISFCFTNCAWGNINNHSEMTSITHC